ncbi:histone-lysine N-methyltransferase EHMT2 [Elysia marginata]|uniref:Histone-lysine N-methyltransferase EHMT2 n=1 Tax=Elysia marginata TaxID=1093978 RepID=A0AAV4JGE1_9GAST|nr:histone-lysine N-methyltransferase EHMT2 [Elysia marginata]
MESDQAECEEEQVSEPAPSVELATKPDKPSVNGLKVLFCKHQEQNGDRGECDSDDTDLFGLGLGSSTLDASCNNEPEASPAKETENINGSVDQASPAAAANSGDNHLSEVGTVGKFDSAVDPVLEENGTSDGLPPKPPLDAASTKVSDSEDHMHISPKLPGEGTKNDSQNKMEEKREAPGAEVSHLSPVSEASGEENMPVEESDSEKLVQDSNDIEVKQKVSTPIPTPVFEDITDDDDSDADTAGDNIELELDDLIEPSEVDAENTSEDKKSKHSSGDSVNEQAAESQDQVLSSENQNSSSTVIGEEVNNTPEETTKSNFTLMKSKETEVAKPKLFPKQKVTARKSGKPVSQFGSAPLKTINLHPIKDITMDVSEVEGALYLSKSSISNAGCPESKETSSTENSVSINDIKPFLGGRKKRRKKSYDLPGCTRKRIKKIRSDAESIGSSADSMSLADSVSLSDGDFQEPDSHKDALGLTNETTGDKPDTSSHPVPKVESALDILTKNSHLSFAKKPRLHSSSSSSFLSTMFPSSRKHLFPPYKVGAAKKSGKIKSVLDMLHRRSQQRAESSSEAVSITSAGTRESTSVSTVSSNDSSSSSTSTGKTVADTRTTTICVTSSESSTTTTIMVSPIKPVVEEEVICLSDSDDSDEKSKKGKRKREVSLNGSMPVSVATLTSPPKGQSLLAAKPRPLASSAPGVSAGSTPAPVVMVVAQHSTAAGMRSLLPQHTLLQASGGVVMQGGKVVKPPAGSNLLPLISTLPIGAKAVNIASLPAGMTALPITSLANVAGSGGQQTVTLFGPISATGAAGAAVPLTGANFVNISGSKHLVYSPAPLQTSPGGKKLAGNKNTTSLLPSLSTLPLSSSSPAKPQILLASPKSSLSSTTKLATGSVKASPSILPATSAPAGNNLESLRALLVGKPVALNSVARPSFSSSVASSTSNSLLSSTPVLFQMVTSSGTSLVPISAQPMTLTSASSPQLKNVQQHHQQSLLKNPPLSSSLLVAANSSTSTISSKSAINGSSSSLAKPHVPNGLSCLTPPKTPDNDTSMEVAAAATLSKHVSHQAETSDVIPLCCCKVNGASFPKLTNGHTYCQALDSVDNKILGCFNKVTNSVLVRPGVKIPFMAMCEAHRRKLKLHQCCPGCGHFCIQGLFLQCRKDGKESVHTFHKQCVFYRGGKHLCPHCGEECSTTQVHLKMEEGLEGGVSEVTMPSRLPSKRDSSFRKMARMGGRSVRKSKSTSGAKEENHLNLPDNTEIDISAIPLGPDQQTLTKLSKCAIDDRPKKYRAMLRDLYTPASEGDVEKVFYLLMDRMDPNQRYEEQEGQTAMHAAATSGSISTVVLLQQFGGEIHAQDKSLRTPMMCAAESGNLEVVKFLNKAGAKVEDRGEDGMTSLHYAAKAGHIDIVQYILSTERLDVNIEDDGGWTPIIWATESQLLDVVKFLIKHGGDPSKKDNEENTGLHWAAFSGSLDISEVFLDLGCELDSPNEHGDRPLHIAARQDHYDIVVLLLARGANVNLKNNKEETPVECCINQSSQVCMALKVNQKLRGFAAHKLIQPERLVERDVSMGREKNPIACVNSEDDEPCPTDFLYVTQNVETSWLNINNVITSLQSCRCKDDCSSMYCVCGRSSIRCWYDKMGRLIEEVNLLEPPLVFECNRACRCLINCNNRVVQNGITCRLQMFRTNGRGWGLRTLMDIPKGTFVCEYVGELISDSEADIREDDSYLFDLDNKDGDTYCIDARKYGNVSRFINHLCEPNLVPVKVFVEHQDLRFPRICLFSSKDIAAYEELGFDYGEKFWMIKWKFFTCACKSSKCKYSSETIHKTLEDYKLRYPDEQVD